MKRTLAHVLRPRKLSQLIGQPKLVAQIRNQYKSEREPPAWQFQGVTGTGKTTVARILALSLQCTHAEFGEPCDECYANRLNFSIRDVNASHLGGKEDMAKLVDSAQYMPAPPSRRIVIILDEAQKISDSGQNLLLKAMEDTPDTTVWIVATSEPTLLKPAFARRCEIGILKLLQVEDIKKLIRRAFKYTAYTGELEPLLDALCEAKIQSSGIILNAVEKYVNGMDAADAVKLVGGEADVLAICRALEKGDWNEIKKQTKEATGDDLRGIRAAVAAYLRGALESAIPGPRAMDWARAIDTVARVDSYTDATQGPATVAALYQLCQQFTGPIRGQDDED
jgi:replication-associated recombination protein RarA